MTILTILPFFFILSFFLFLFSYILLPPSPGLSLSLAPLHSPRSPYRQAPPPSAFPLASPSSRWLAPLPISLSITSALSPG